MLFPTWLVNWELYCLCYHWTLCLVVVTTILLSKVSWDYCKKFDSDNIINLWKMTFQASDGKDRHFLNLVNHNSKDIELSYIKGGSWLQSFGHSNSLCTWATRAITNHAPIGEYHLQFFPNEDFKCSCGSYPIKTRRHILHECMRHNGYWNSRRDSLSHFVMFLNANPKAFAFIDNVLSAAPSWPWSDFHFIIVLLFLSLLFFSHSPCD